jgi:hypothetical protein
VNFVVEIKIWMKMKKEEEKNPWNLNIFVFIRRVANKIDGKFEN